MAASKHDGFNYGLIFRKTSKNPDISRGSGRKTAKNTVSKQLVALRSSASADWLSKLLKNPGITTIPGFFCCSTSVNQTKRRCCPFGAAPPFTAFCTCPFPEAFYKAAPVQSRFLKRQNRNTWLRNCCFRFYPVFQTVLKGKHP